jgi:hypothetical protein
MKSFLKEIFKKIFLMRDSVNFHIFISNLRIFYFISRVKTHNLNGETYVLFSLRY